jgi:YbbR domain-containing protein
MAWRDLVLNNFWFKLLSFILALMVWFAVDSHLKRQRGSPRRAVPTDEAKSFRRPVTLLTSANNRRVFQVDPFEVSVRVTGEPARLREVQAEEIQVFVKLIEVPEPRGSFPVTVNLPRNVTLQEVSPSSVQIEPVSPN